MKSCNEPIFVVGVGRSGTTLIRLMLHSHPSIAIPYESHFITRYQDKIAEYGDLAEQNNIEKLIDDILHEPLLLQWDHQFDLTKVRTGVREQSLAGAINAIFLDYAYAKGKRRWGDKSDYLSRMYTINRLFPKAKFIHCIRDGRDVARSVMKLQWGPQDIIQAAEWWSSSVRLGRAMGLMLPVERYCEVRYEDLVSSPEEELSRLCTFLKEEYSPSMLEYYIDAERAIPPERRSQHYNIGVAPDASRALAWKRGMSKTDVALFQKYASAELATFGYEIVRTPVTRSRLEAKRAWLFSRRFAMRKQS